MELEQSIPHSKRSPGRIGGKMKYQAYVTAWDITIPRSSGYQQDYGEILKSVLANTDANPLQKELRNINISEYNDITKQ